LDWRLSRVYFMAFVDLIAGPDVGGWPGRTSFLGNVGRAVAVVIVVGKDGGMEAHRHVDARFRPGA